MERAARWWNKRSYLPLCWKTTIWPPGRTRVHGSEVTTSRFSNSALIHGLCSYHWAGHKSSPATCTQSWHSFSSCRGSSPSLGGFPANSWLGRTPLSSPRPPGSSRAFHVRSLSLALESKVRLGCESIGPTPRPLRMVGARLSSVSTCRGGNVQPEVTCHTHHLHISEEQCGRTLQTIEGVTDFRALRAKFQNDSNLASKLVQPHKKPPTEIVPKLGSGGNAVSSPLPLSKREGIILKPKGEPAHPARPHPALTQCNPLAHPPAKLGYVEPTGHNREHKGNILEKGPSSPKNSPQKPLPSHCTDRQGSAQRASEGPALPSSFHHALRMWENTLSCSEKASATLPAQRAANLYVHPSLEQRAARAPAVLSSSRMRPAGSEPALALPAQKKDALRGRGPALPHAPTGHRSSDEAGAEGAVATKSCQLGYRAPREQPQHQKGSEPPFCQPRAGKWSPCPRSKWPRIKPLPSAESLGPAPGKPARPPKFDLSAFQSAILSVHRGNETTAEEEDYLTPESAQLEEHHNYEETLMYLNQSGDTTTLCVIEVPKAEPEEHKKQKTDFLFAKSSSGGAVVEDEKEEEPSLEREKQEAKKILKTGGNGYISPTSSAKEDGGGGVKVLPVKQDVSSTQAAEHPTLQGLAKDGAEILRYMHVGAPKPGVEITALNQNTWQSLQAWEDIYDDVGEMQDRLSHGSDASSPFTSASISGNGCEETYEDVETGGDNPTKLETEKQKRFGNLFKIEKLKLKNTRFKENLRLFSTSTPNLAAVSQEDMVYDNVEVGQRELRNIFKIKKSNVEKSRKMEKEEKFFRETFMYDKEINIVNTAIAACSVPSKRRVDLPVIAGEQLDVIDVAEDNAVICRNLEGRYGYVLVEHLNFRCPLP
ncbi:FYN-binding protein 2 isoform X3 [Falco rusticolus]|uniref:FYN-binding protein 2 isoform X3 n=1 Tax=Falco rusticolus TaxID=120794 RepID=UPI00188693E4|nr:FYN-binding protein 2 isoform X3 [Falco rusticolus]